MKFSTLFNFIYNKMGANKKFIAPDFQSNVMNSIYIIG